MQLLLTSAAPLKHQTGWRHNHSNSKLCVRLAHGAKLIFSVSRIVVFCAGGHALLHAQFSRQLDLCVSSLSRGAMSSSQGKKNDPEFVRVILVQGKLPYRSKKKPSQILTAILVQGPCSNIQSRSVQQQCLAEDKASGSSRSSYLRTSIRGFHRFAPS